MKSKIKVGSKKIAKKSKKPFLYYSNCTSTQSLILFGNRETKLRPTVLKLRPTVFKIKS